MPGAAVLMPVKAFASAKARLAGVLDPQERVELGKRLASGVVSASGQLPVFVACDDREVATWAADHHAGIVWTHGCGLNQAVTAGFEALQYAAFDQVVIAHADLARPVDLESITWFPDATIAPDRHGDGTNVLVLPTTHRGQRLEPVFGYGARSADLHVRSLRALGLAVRVLHDHPLGWDVDVPDDLTALDITALDVTDSTR